MITLSDRQLDTVLVYAQRNKAILTNEVNGPVEMERLMYLWGELADKLNELTGRDEPMFDGEFQPVRIDRNFHKNRHAI